MLKVHPNYSARKLAEVIGITPKAVEKHLARLKAEGLILREGPDKGGIWIVKKTLLMFVLLVMGFSAWGLWSIRWTHASENPTFLLVQVQSVGSSSNFVQIIRVTH